MCYHMKSFVEPKAGASTAAEVSLISYGPGFLTPKESHIVSDMVTWT